MNVLANVCLDLIIPKFITIHAVQDDKLTRTVHARLLAGGLPWQVPSGALALVRFIKPDRTSGFYDTLEDGSPAVTVETGRTSISFTLAQQALAVPGDVFVQINFYTSAGAALSSFSLRVDVHRSVCSDDSIVSGDYYNALTATLADMASEVEAFRAAMQAGYGAPRVATSAADMTNLGCVYVYTGTTGGGLTYGHWYTWSGSAWTDGGIYQSAGINTDTTLTNADMAANAKAAGDAIRAVSKNVDAVSEVLTVESDVALTYSNHQYIKSNGASSNSSDYDRYYFRNDDGAIKKISVTSRNASSHASYLVAFYSTSTSSSDSFISGGNFYSTSDTDVHTEVVSVPDTAVLVAICSYKDFTPIVKNIELMDVKSGISNKIEKENTIYANDVAPTYLSHRNLNKYGIPASTTTNKWNLYKLDVSDCDGINLELYGNADGSASTKLPVYSFVSSDFADVTSTSETSANVVDTVKMFAPTSELISLNIVVPAGAKTMFIACIADQATALKVIKIDYGHFEFLTKAEEIPNIVDYTQSPFYRNVRWGTSGLNDYYHSVDDGISLFNRETTASQYFSMFNTLVADYEPYVEAREMGLASDETTMMYYYTFNPLTNQDTTTYKRPKFIISSGQHGFEKVAPFGLYWFVKNLLEDWESNSALAYIRNHVQLVVMPLLNPYGFDNDKYVNANGVNLNRNWDTWAWSQGTAGTTSYAGSEPFSEVETQYARDVILANLDAFWMCDVHNNGQVAPSSPTGYLWHSFALQTYEDPYFEKSINAAKAHIDETTGHLYKDYPTLLDYAVSGHWTDNNAPSHQGLIGAYAREHGIMASTLEAGAAIIGSGSRFSSPIHHLNADLIGNWLRYIINCYSIL